MSLESARKLGVAASLINIILPVVAVIGIVAYLVYVFTTTVNRIAAGPVAPAFGVSISLIALIVSVGALAVIGFILFMVAMHRLSIYYSEPSIFKNVLYAFLISVISGSVLVILEFTVFTSLLTGIPQTGTSTTPFLFTQFIFTYLAVIGLSIVFAIVNAVLYMRAFNKLAEKSGIDDFKTTGLLYLLGIVLTIVSVGILLVWIAWIYAYLGFNKLKPKTEAPTFSYQTQPPLSTMQAKRCPNCGAENSADSLYCRNCGNRL